MGEQFNARLLSLELEKALGMAATASQNDAVDHLFCRKNDNALRLLCRIPCGAV